jgi:ParB family transcriptional regulator, chromosome partitioning protein
VQTQKKGLGKGLGALIPAAELPAEPSQQFVDVEQIVPNALQPRRSFDEAKIDELATSIQDQGIIQPLLVRRTAGGYELIAGERRLRAAMKAGLSKVPVVVREASDNDSLQLALIENVQREDLNAIEEAQAYRRLQEEFHLGQEEIAQKVGKSRPAVANSMRLLQLPEEVQREVTAGTLSAGHARALLALERGPVIIAAAREVIAKGLSAREVERLVRRLKGVRRLKRAGSLLDPDLRSFTEQLQRCLGTKVRVIHRGNRGKIEIDYYSLTDLERISRVIGIEGLPV